MCSPCVQAIALSDAVDMPPPDLPEVVEMDEEEQLAAMLVSLDGGASLRSIAGSCWDSDYERDFYERLPELRSTLPGILFKVEASVSTCSRECMCRKVRQLQSR